jgi:hypothetical protein
MHYRIFLITLWIFIFGGTIQGQQTPTPKDSAYTFLSVWIAENGQVKKADMNVIIDCYRELEPLGIRFSGNKTTFNQYFENDLPVKNNAVAKKRYLDSILLTGLTSEADKFKFKLLLTDILLHAYQEHITTTSNEWANYLEKAVAVGFDHFLLIYHFGRGNDTKERIKTMVQAQYQQKQLPPASNEIDLLQEYYYKKIVADM